MVIDDSGRSRGPVFSCGLPVSPGLLSGLLGAIGVSWALMSSPGLSWALLGSPRLSWKLFSAVRDSRMWCPHDIGRDSWVWGEQETLYNIISPHEVGDEALTV